VGGAFYAADEQTDNNPLICKMNLDPMALINPKSNSEPQRAFLFYGHSVQLEVQLLDDTQHMTLKKGTTAHVIS